MPAVPRDRAEHEGPPSSDLESPPSALAHVSARAFWIVFAVILLALALFALILGWT